MSSPESKAASYGADASGLTHGGALRAKGRRFAIVASRFNAAVVDKLIDGAREALRQAGAAAESSGRAPALTDFGLGAQVLAHLGARRIRLLTNHPRRIVGLGGYGLEIVECVPIRP
ncbi:MAG TPA: 6,7-dimethyl-8-ribityllumazine synthase, partial [Polyangia bacterium]|nr:6,7-dimethyl-8-ribityllumazine synthase [Polyangia bacterium]